MDVQFSAGSLVWRIRWRTEAKWSDRSTYLGCPRLSRSRILLEADICAAIEQEGAARVGDGRQRKSQPCWCQSQRNHSEVWRAAGAAERVRRAGRRCCFLIRREEKRDFLLQSCGWDKNSPYSPVAEPRITHRAPESHGASIPKTPRRVTRCEATLYSGDGLFSSERRQEVTLATINERDRKGSTHPARFRKDWRKKTGFWLDQ